MLTSKQATLDIFNLLRGSDLANTINGEVYYEGDRPRDSVKEDIVIVFITGRTGEVERGNINVLVYVPDKAYQGNGVMTQKHQRLKQIETLAVQWFETLNQAGTPYKFDIDPIISVAEDESINQHYVIVPLHYEYYNQL